MTRYVTLRHATSSGAWCIEAPHLSGLAAAGYFIVKNTRDKQHYIYKSGMPVTAG